jgi:hypothetical protein
MLLGLLVERRSDGDAALSMFTQASRADGSVFSVCSAYFVLLTAVIAGYGAGTPNGD